MFKRSINFMNIFLFINFYSNALERDVELNLADECSIDNLNSIDSLEHLTKGHKCKKSKCFCSLKVRNKLCAKNIIARNDFTAKKITASNLTTENIKAISVNTDTINGSYLVIDPSESLYLLRGTIALPEDFDVNVTLTPSTNPTSAPYPYSISTSFMLNGQAVDSLPLNITVGKGFTVGNLAPKSPAGIDLAQYGMYPHNGPYYKVGGLSGQDTDAIFLFFKIPVSFNQPFNDIPVIIIERNFNTKFVPGSGELRVPGGTAVLWIHVRPENVTKNGFEIFYYIEILLAGTQSEANLPAIEKNISNILRQDLYTMAFVVAGS